MALNPGTEIVLNLVKEHAAARMRADRSKAPRFMENRPARAKAESPAKAVLAKHGLTNMEALSEGITRNGRT